MNVLSRRNVKILFERIGMIIENNVTGKISLFKK
jgi:hypothetical protein